MIQSSSIIFLQLQKTGCTHAELLLRQIGATGNGKHQALRGDWRTGPARKILGGVRNPWDWYVSFFAYGCEGRGGITGEYLLAPRCSAPRLTTARNRLRNVPKTALAKSLPVQMLYEARRRPSQWEALLSDVNNVDNFRRFVMRLLDPAHRFDSAMDFGYSPFAGQIGLFTYLYLLLYLRDRSALFRADGPLAQVLAAPDKLDTLMHVDYFIPMESLESSLIEAVAAAGEPAAAATIAENAGKTLTNASNRERNYRVFYDDALRDLVADRERLIIARHAYTF